MCECLIVVGRVADQPGIFAKGERYPKSCERVLAPACVLPCLPTLSLVAELCLGLFIFVWQAAVVASTPRSHR